MWQCTTCFTLLSWWELPDYIITWLGDVEKKPGSKEYAPVVNPGSASLSYASCDYVNSLPRSVEQCQVKQYADGTILLIVSVGWKRCWRMVWIVLVYINCLKLKLKKPQWILMGRKCRTQDLENWYCHGRASVLPHVISCNRQVWRKC